MTDQLVLDAPAKINLTLEILGRRHDGYHNLVSIMQTLELRDRVTLTKSSDVRLSCDEHALETDDNLALVAAHALRDASGYDGGVEIKLEKHIPLASGLGGGSSDAAAVLIGLNRLWNVGMTMGELASLSLTLGSDVPYFLRAGTALVQGRGDDITPLPHASLDWVVVMSPDIQLDNKTGTLYSRVGQDHYTRGLLSHKLAGRIRAGGDVPSQFLFNAFEPIARNMFPELSDAQAAFRSVGAAEVHLSGAGPSLFALPPNRETGLAWQLLLERQGHRAYLTRPWWPDRAS